MSAGRAPFQPSLKGRALRYLSQREHSRAELERKLKPWALAAVNAELAESSQCELGAPGAPGALGALGDPSDHDEPDSHLLATAHIAAALDELASKGFLSDARAAESVLNTKSPRYGALRIRQELRAKGLSADLVQATLARAKSTEFERALAIWQRKFGGRSSKGLTHDEPGFEIEAKEPATDGAKVHAKVHADKRAKDRAKQMRFLAARGFSGDVVAKVMQAGAVGTHAEIEHGEGNIDDEGVISRSASGENIGEL